MAEFGINATQLSAPQGQGTDPIAPVQEQVSSSGVMDIASGLADLFMTKKAAYNKQQAADRKSAVLKAYVDEENKYSEAFKTGQWDSNRAASASRANYAKFIAANSDLIPELAQARTSVYGGTEMSEVQKQEDRAAKLKEKMIDDATAIGYQFYPGMSKASEDAALTSFQEGRRVEENIRKLHRNAQEARAINGENRAQKNFELSLEDRQLKDGVIEGLRTVASANFDDIQTTGMDLFNKIRSGQVTPEVALQFHQQNMSRVQAAITSVGTSHPELAGPYSRLFGDMDVTIRAMLDPNKKSETELKALQDQFNTMVVKSKIMALEKNPGLLKAYTASTLFSNDSIVDLGGSPAISRWMLSATEADPSLKSNEKLIGSGEDGQIFSITTKALNDLYSGRIPATNKESATIEATNLVNRMLKETATVEGSIAPNALKAASKFYASSEFGKLALEGKIDKATAANAQEVFQVKYEPAVRSAILNRLNEEVAPGETLSKSVKFEMVGNNVVVKPNLTENKDSGGFISGFIGEGMQGIRKIAGVDAVKEAGAGLNQLIRLHAHLEGTTDYAKYWEKNKHIIMPDFFPNPAVLKPGQVEDGHEYLGGNYRDPRNWKVVKKDDGK